MAAPPPPAPDPAPVALVTGASRGIGRATAVAFGALGHTVVVVARTTAGRPHRLGGSLEETAAAVDAAGGLGVPHPADLARAEEVERAVAATLERFGRLDVLVNNAAIATVGGVELGAAAASRTFAVNVVAPWVATAAAAPAMRAAGRGRICNVSSRAALEWYPGMGLYGASKAALEHATVTAAAELDGTGVTVNALRIDVPVATEGYLANAGDRDTTGWLDPDVAAAGIVWMCGRDDGYTGRLESMRELARRTGLMPEAAARAPVPPTRWALSRARGEADAPW